MNARRSSNARRLFIGCSGWNYRDWKERVYPKELPARRWLEHYATLFETVEVNNTFYRLASQKAVSTWVSQTPKDFVFALKASRYLTHVKRLTEVEAGVRRFLEPLEPLRESGKLGPIVWQLPPTFSRDDERLENALQQLPPGSHCIEFRDPSWFTDEVYDMLTRHGVALVVGDHPERSYQALRITTGFTLVRFHQGSATGGKYTDAELSGWVSQLQDWRKQADVYAYFNNDQCAYAVENATALKRMVNAS